MVHDETTLSCLCGCFQHGHPTLPEDGDYVINGLQNNIIRLQREDATNDQIYQAMDGFKWYPERNGPPRTMCNPLVF